MAGRVIVGGMRKRPAERPMLAARCQHWQVFTNLNARRAGRYRLELATDSIRCIGLHVEAIVLGQSAGEKYINDRAGLRFIASVIGRSQSLQMVGSQTQQADRPGLNSRAS